MKLSVAGEGKYYNIWGMDETAQQLFKQNNIEVVVGAQGNFIDAIEKYINGSLKSTDFVCTEHENEGYCNE